MKRIISVLFVCILASCNFCIVLLAETETAEPPTEVKLKSGTILRRVEVVRFENDRVILKHLGGADPIRLDMISEPTRSKLLVYRDEWKRMQTKNAEKQSLPRTVSGQVYIVTRGRDNYELGDLIVHFVLKSEMDHFLNTIPPCGCHQYW